jgi:NADH-quinone oxidoreductase subunit N
VVPKVGAILGLAQVVRSLPTSALDWRAALAVLAVVSMTYGNLAALGQDNVVRLLAYSSISQAGYFLLGAIDLGHGSLALQSLIVFAAAYAASNLGAFAVVARVGRNLSAYAGVGRIAPWIGAAMTLFLLSLVGVPPLAGFAGKLLLFGAAIDAGYAWLAVVAILNSVLSLAVYLRIIVTMYRPGEGELGERPSSTAVWTVSLALTVILGVAVQVLLGHIA